MARAGAAARDSVKGARERPRAASARRPAPSGKARPERSAAAPVGPRRGGSEGAPQPARVVGAVVSSLRVLRRLASLGEPQTVTQLARDLGVNPSTCFNILRTLAAEDVVVFHPASKTYGLGRGLGDIAGGVYRGGLDIAAVQPRLQGFAQDHDVTVTLWRRLGERLVLAAVAEGHGDHVIRMRIGQRVPLLLGANGRCVAAFGGLPEAELRARFAEVVWARPLTFAGFQKQVEATLRRGWAHDDGQYSAHLVGLSAPLRRDSDPVDAMIGASMFVGQYDARTVAGVGDALLRLSQDLSRHVFGLGGEAAPG